MITADREAILFANSAFYAAFTGRDIDAMERLWADGAVCCVHPGWVPLYGREAVLKSWRGILGNAAAPAVAPRAVRVEVRGGLGIVTCIEVLTSANEPDQSLAATNVFVRDGSLWKMIHHQAGHANLDPRRLPPEERPPMN
jgi:ketosteroid isomerase-like protein